MHQYISQSIQKALSTYQKFYSSHGRIARNTAILTIILGTSAGAFILFTVKFLITGLDPFTGNLIVAANHILFDCMGVGTHLTILTGSLLAIHFYRNQLPATGVEFVTAIPRRARQLYLTGIIVILLFFSVHTAINTKISTDSNIAAQTLDWYHWLSKAIYFSMTVTTCIFTVNIYLRGVIQHDSEEHKPVLITVALLLYCWITMLFALSYSFNDTFILPITILLPEEIIGSVLCSISYVLAFIAGTLPTSAITSSIVTPESDIILEGETETHL